MKNPTDNNTPIDLNKERNKRIHDIHEKRLQDVHNAFEKAFPLPTTNKAKKTKKNKKGKKR